MQEKHLPPRDGATQHTIELDIWFSAFAVSLPPVDEPYVRSILSKTKINLGIRVVQAVKSEWNTSYNGRDFKELSSIPAASLIHIHGTEAIHAFDNAVATLNTGGPDIDNYVPPRPSNPDPFYWSVEEMVDDLIDPETEEQALEESTRDYLKSKENETLLLRTKDPRKFIEEYTTERIAHWKKAEEESKVDDPGYVFMYQMAQRALALTRDRFVSIYDVAEKIESKAI